MTETLTRLRYKYWPDHWVGEILSKRWTETAVPVLLLVMVVFFSGQLVPNFYSATMLADTLRQAGEIGFIVLGMALVFTCSGALVGLAVTTFAFLGVNMFLSGLHSYGEL